MLQFSIKYKKSQCTVLAWWLLTKDLQALFTIAARQLQSSSLVTQRQEDRPMPTRPWINLYCCTCLLDGGLHPLHLFMIWFCNIISKSSSLGPHLLFLWYLPTMLQLTHHGHTNGGCGWVHRAKPYEDRTSQWFTEAGLRPPSLCHLSQAWNAYLSFFRLSCFLHIISHCSNRENCSLLQRSVSSKEHC